MSEQVAHDVGPARIDIAYERFGDPAAPPVLLIMGAGAQMINWPEGFCAELVDRGLHVIRFDNRDAGRSTHCTDAPAPDFGGALSGDLSSVAYTLSDMAADTVGLLDVLGVDSAHVVGASLGGMVAQTMAIEHPGRVRSLTSIFSTTGDRSVGQADFSALASIGGPPQDRQGFIEWQVKATRALGSPGFPFDEAGVAERAARTYDRGIDPVGMMRQAVAVIASGDRTARLRELRVPTLVMHGTADKMVDLSGGQATAAAIPGAKLVTFEGMGHSLPEELWPAIATHITDLVQRAEATR